MIKQTVKRFNTTQKMETKITEAVYKTALARIEELLPLVTDDTSPEDRRTLELKIMSDIVIDYEEHHFPISINSQH